MPRRPYVHLAGDLSYWPLGFVPQPAHMRRLDQFSSELVDGEGGGTWAPEEPIILGPCGGTPSISLTTSGSVLSGDIETGADNDLGDETETPGLILQGGAVPAFESSRTRTIVVGFTNAIASTDFSAARSLQDFYAVDPVTLASSQLYSPVATDTLAVPLPIRAQHRGATISQVDFQFRIDTLYSSLPTLGFGLPTFRVVRNTGFTLAPLHSNAGGYDANGYLPDPAASLAAFVNGGKVRTVSYVPNQNNTNIDSGSSWFLAQFVSLPVSLLIGCVVYLTGIADYRQE